MFNKIHQNINFLYSASRGYLYATCTGIAEFISCTREYDWVESWIWSSPVRSVMITARIGRHKVLLTINHNCNKICDIYIYSSLKHKKFRTMRAVSYFSLQSYSTRNLSTRAAKPRAVRNEGVSPRRSFFSSSLNCNNNVVVCNRAGWDKN